MKDSVKTEKIKTEVVAAADNRDENLLLVERDAFIWLIKQGAHF